MYIATDLESKELIDMLDEDLSQEDAFQLICAIEEKILDIKFTERLISHFIKIKREECN